LESGPAPITAGSVCRYGRRRTHTKTWNVNNTPLICWNINCQYLHAQVTCDSPCYFNNSAFIFTQTTTPLSTLDMHAVLPNIKVRNTVLSRSANNCLSAIYRRFALP
jgi:hypothetical protein